MSTMNEPLFHRLKDIAALGNGINDSMTSLCSEAEREELAMTWSGGMPQRQASTLSTASMSSLSASKKKKKKAAVWAEKYESTAVVFGPLTTHDDFKDLVLAIKQNVGEIKSHYYREEQFCGFVYFHIEDLADDCKHRYNNTAFKGQTIRACSPSQFFKNEEDAFPDPVARIPNRSLTAQMSTLSVASTMTSGIAEPSATLVIKNLCFGLKQEKLLDFMASLKVPPQSVSYHYDNNGLFRGVAFAKYISSDSAGESLKELEGAEIGGRKLRVEFKRRTNAMPTSPLRQQSFDASLLSPARGRHSSVPNVPAHSASSLTPTPLLSMVNSAFNRSAPAPISSPSRPLASPSRVGGAALLATPPDFPVTPIKNVPSPEQDRRSPTPITSSPIVIREGMEFEDVPTFPSVDLIDRPPPAVQSLKFDDPLTRPILRAGMEFV